jgi:hypothetical protein
VLRTAIQGISDLINNDGLINLDFADVRTVMAGMGQAIMGLGTGSGENRAIEAAEKAIHSPLLDNVSIDGAKGILINVTGPSSMTLHEVYEAASFIEDHADDEANIIFGATIDETLDDRLEITVIATGFGGNDAEKKLARGEKAVTLPRPRATFKVFSSHPGGETPREEREDRGEIERAPLALSSSLAPSTPLGAAEERTAPPPVPPLVAPHVAPSSPVALNPMAGDPVTSSPADKDDAVFELHDPIMEPIETTPRIPSSYRPEEKRGNGRNGLDSDLDIPTFIRRRSKTLDD